MTNNIEQHLPIFVIGAGIAGISCAKKMHDSGKQVIVLEAKDYIGGRIHSVKSNSKVFDLGASWIHGIQHNPIYEITQKQQICTTVLNYEQVHYVHEDGQPFSHEQSVEFEFYIKKIQTLLAEYQEISALDALQSIIPSLEYSNTVIPEHTLKSLLFAYFELVAHDPYATELAQLSAQFQDYEGYLDGDEVIFPQGYFQVIDSLAHNLAIKTGVIIQKILIEGKHIKIIDQNNMTYLGSKVVVTVPLGMLKQQQIEFNPVLNHSYHNAIQNMGFGSFNKVFFELDTPLPLNRPSHTHCNSHFYFQDHTWFNIFDLSQIYQKPIYLMMYGGKQSEWIDHATDDEVWSLIAHRLDNLFNYKIDMPNHLIITRWGVDPFSYGAFSFPSVHYAPQLVEVWQQPIQNLIYFAGEHCHLKYPATVHGAYLSGYETALSILNT